MGELDASNRTFLIFVDVDGQGGVFGGEHDDVAGKLVGLEPS